MILRAAAAFASVFLLLAPAEARADDLAAEADLQFQIGAERYQAHDFRGALEHFLASNRLVPNRNVVFNIARSYEQLEQFSDAYRFYVQALEGETDAAARERLQAAVARMVPRVAIVRVETVPAGATIYVERRDLGPRGETPRSLAFAAGRYHVIVERAGFERAERDVEAVVGREVRVSLELREILGTLKVDGSPAGAAVHVDSESAPVACTLPCDVPYAPGRYLLYVTADGYQTSSQVAVVRESQTTRVHARLSAVTGSLLVDADEPEALIEVDGRSVGFTPAVVSVPAGTRSVRVTLRGFRPVTQIVDVNPNEQTRMRIALEPIEEVTAASRVTQAVEDAPSSVTIVPREEIDAFAYPTVVEALRGVRGLYVSDDRSYPAVGVRGLGRPGDYGNRLLVLLDGHPTNDDIVGSSYVGYDLRTDLEDVERIEVVRGPGSVLYGTSAFSGVINVVTRDRDEPSGADAGVSTNEYGVARGRGGFRLRFGDDAGMWASIAAARGEGRDFYFREFDDDATLGRARGLDWFEAGTIGSRVWWGDFTLQLSLHTREKSLPTAEYETVFAAEGTTQADSRALVEARFEPQLGSHLRLLSRAFFNAYAFDGQFVYEGLDVYREAYRGDWGGAELRLEATLTEAIKITAGGEVQEHLRASLHGESSEGVYLDRDEPNRQGAAYLLADVDPSDRLRISGGARLDAYSTFGTSINPRVAVIARPWTGGNVKILGGQAFRAPSVYELFYEDDGVSQAAPESLEPETISSAEIEVSQRFARSWTALVTGYGTFAEHLVVQETNADGLTEYANSERPIRTVGGEVGLRRDWRQGWSVSGSYSLQRTRTVDDLFADATAGRAVPSSPTHLASVRGVAPLVGDDVVAATRLTYEGARFDRNDTAGDPPQAETDAAVLWDVVLSGHADRWHLRWSAGVYNLFDWRWYAPVSREFTQTVILQNGRTVLMSVLLEY